MREGLEIPSDSDADEVYFDEDPWALPTFAALRDMGEMGGDSMGGSLRGSFDATDEESGVDECGGMPPSALAEARAAAKAKAQPPQTRRPLHPRHEPARNGVNWGEPPRLDPDCSDSGLAESECFDHSSSTWGVPPPQQDDAVQAKARGVGSFHARRVALMKGREKENVGRGKRSAPPPPAAPTAHPSRHAPVREVAEGPMWGEGMDEEHGDALNHSRGSACSASADSMAMPLQCTSDDPEEQLLIEQIQMLQELLRTKRSEKRLRRSRGEAAPPRPPPDPAPDHLQHMLLQHALLRPQPSPSHSAHEAPVYHGQGAPRSNPPPRSSPQISPRALRQTVTPSSDSARGLPERHNVPPPSLGSGIKRMEAVETLQQVLQISNSLTELLRTSRQPAPPSPQKVTQSPPPPDRPGSALFPESGSPPPRTYAAQHQPQITVTSPSPPNPFAQMWVPLSGCAKGSPGAPPPPARSSCSTNRPHAAEPFDRMTITVPDLGTVPSTPVVGSPRPLLAPPVPLSLDDRLARFAAAK